MAKKSCSSLSKEISAIVILKLIALWIIWTVCFSHPIDHQLDSHSLNKHLLSNA